MSEKIEEIEKKVRAALDTVDVKSYLMKMPPDRAGLAEAIELACHPLLGDVGPRREDLQTEIVKNDDGSATVRIHFKNNLAKHFIDTIAQNMKGRGDVK